MTLLRIAFRNVLKNRRRSLITVLAIGFGFTAVGVFRGYTHNAYEMISIAAVYLEAPGHLVLFKKGYLEEGKIDPSAYLLTGQEVEEIQEVVARNPAVRWTAPKMTLSGLVTNGTVSTIFIADAMDPERETALWSHWDFRRPPSAGSDKVLPADQPYAAFVAPKLAKLLDIDIGDSAVLMLTTQYGQMNASDIEVAALYPALSDAVDDKYLRIPLSLARSLYDFDGADRVCVLLDNANSGGKVQREITAALQAAGYAMDVRSWDQLSVYYQNVKGYLDVVFGFIFTIVMVIVVMGTFNTMSMSVFERTREIGTLRAMGMKPGSVIRLFSLEGALLGLAGSLAGIFLTLATFWALRVAQFTYKPPGVANEIPIEIDFVPEVLLVAMVFFVLLAVMSAVLPARRSARQNIVSALAHT